MKSFSVSLIRVPKKFGSEGEGVSRISVENFLSHSAKISVGESFTVALISGKEKVRMREGGVSRTSAENVLSHRADNFRSGAPFSVSLISGIEKFYASEAYVKISISVKMFVSQCGTIS